MIKLYYINEQVLVFNLDDWFELRNTHKIIGEIIGNTCFVPSLPVKLLPEEVIYLLNKKIATVYRIVVPSKYDTKIFQDGLLEGQKIEYRKVRRKQLVLMLDKIVEKRRQQNDFRSSDQILDVEVEKSCIVNEHNLIWPIFLEQKHNDEDLEEIPLECIEKTTTVLKSQVYKDLRERNYFITHGHKFGGDFLVYVGDPACYHAMFIIRCVQNEEEMSPQEIVAFGRLGTSVRKRAVLASMLNGEVSYVTINWIDA